MDGFVTLAVGDRYLQMAAVFALSARRFGYETVVMVRDAVPHKYRSLFAETFDLTGRPTNNPPGVYAARELKRYAYEASERFANCCFVDADSLVIRNPARMFAELARTEQIHTPAGRHVLPGQSWASPAGIPTQQAARAMGVPEARVVQTLNGGFLFWQRGEVASRWFDDYGSLYGRLIGYFQATLGQRATVSDELCAGIAFARSGIELWKSNSSIGVWDAAGLQLDVVRERFTCVKHHYWEGHRFEPYIAHFGGGKISSRYRECAALVRQGTDVLLPLFDPPAKRPAAPPATRLPANGFSLSDAELQALGQFVAAHGIQSVLEFGPGRSTECFLDAGCRVTSLEYQPRWLDHYRGFFGNRPQLTLGRFENSEPVALPPGLPRRFDMAFVDSPVGNSAGDGHCSRLNTCLAAASHADLILLHDANRPAEQATVERLRSLGWSSEPVKGAPKVAALRRGRTAGGAQPARPRLNASYDFSHWPSLPRVSCQCITYGRTTLLEEAVESFLRQDYPGGKELVILNDLDTLTLRFDHPQVRVVNLPARMRTIGEKRNACVALCSGDVIFPWDDDDISLPQRISYSLQQMTNHRYFKADRMWTWWAGGVHPEPKRSLGHAMSCWSRTLFDEVGGYPHIQSGQDAGLEKLFEGRGRVIEQTPPSALYYLYRYCETASYHLSGHGYGRGYCEAAQFVECLALRGVHEIRPHWVHDYSALVAAMIQRPSD